MKKLYTKDLKIRKLYLQNYIKRNCLKMIHSNENFSIPVRYEAFNLLTKLKPYSSTRFKNRCVLTNRGKSIDSKTKLSRLMIRKLVANGLISELKKASW